jgi:hypothetical protein
MAKVSYFISGSVYAVSDQWLAVARCYPLNGSQYDWARLKRAQQAAPSASEARAALDDLVRAMRVEIEVNGGSVTEIRISE